MLKEEKQSVKKQISADWDQEEQKFTVDDQAFQVGPLLRNNGSGVVHRLQDSDGRPSDFVVSRKDEDPKYKGLLKKKFDLIPAGFKHDYAFISGHDNCPDVLISKCGKRDIQQFFAKHIQGSRFGVLRALEIFIQVIKKVQALHAAGFVHRDLAPHNVFVRDDGSVMLGDLSWIKKAGEHGQKQVRSTQGALDLFKQVFPFVPPEATIVILADVPGYSFNVYDVNPAIDTYALGYLFYVLSRTMPFHEESVKNALYELFYKMCLKSSDERPALNYVKGELLRICGLEVVKNPPRFSTLEKIGFFLAGGFLAADTLFCLTCVGCLAVPGGLLLLPAVAFACFVLYVVFNKLSDCFSFLLETPPKVKNLAENKAAFFDSPKKEEVGLGVASEDVGAKNTGPGPSDFRALKV